MILHIADITVGFSAAALATLVNEAAMNALKHNNTTIIDENFLAVIGAVQSTFRAAVLSFI